MGKRTYTTHELTGKRALDASSDKRIGKVRRFIFHPTEKRVVGMTIKRPDAALMFHRKDVFVPLGGFTVSSGEVVVSVTPRTADRSVGSIIQAKWDDCVIWVGMPVVTESNEMLGFVQSVCFSNTTGEVISLTTEKGVAQDMLLGKYKIPAECILGFKRGKDSRLSQVYANYNDADPLDRGCILVRDEVLALDTQGGAATVAGKASAVVAHKAKEGGGKAKALVDKKAEQAKPFQDKATRKAEEAIDAGTTAIGNQLGKTKGMFSAFKDELKSALAEDEEDR